MVNFVISFCDNLVSPLGPLGTALHCLAGVQHLVSKPGSAVALQEKTTARSRGELRASLCVRKACAAGRIFGGVCVRPAARYGMRCAQAAQRSYFYSGV